MKKSNLRATAALQALALLGAGLPVAFIAAAPAAAQDYTSGAVLGTVNSSTGAPVAGAAVRLRSLAQNQVQNFVTDGTGAFSAAGLTPGQYELTVTAPGHQTFTGIIDVTAAQSSRVTVDLGAEAAAGADTGPAGGDIVVTGRVRQANTQGTTGLAVDVPAITSNIAVPRSVTGVTLLAPTTTRGVPGFGDVASIGGGSVAENAYFINGLNITDPDTYVGSSRVPFDFYKTIDVQTGGYPAEFGRATGGVINATTKQGTNVPFVGLHLNWQPAALQGHRPNIGVADSPQDIGNESETERKSAILEAGGAIIQDHLFVYGLIEGQRNKFESASGSSHTFSRTIDNDPFWGVKVDGYITPTQHAEFTIFDTRSRARQNIYDYTPNDNFTGGTVGDLASFRFNELGGLNWVGRYTGNLTDWITLSAAYGISKDRGNLIPSDPNANLVTDRRTATTGGVATTISQQKFASNNIRETKRRFYRGDADVRFTAMGNHHVRMGFDNEDVSEIKTTRRNGVVPVNYSYSNSGITLTYVALGGNISGTNTAYYIQDSWSDLVEGLTLNVGLRNDFFKQYNLSGERYANLKNNWGPRLGFTYTPPAAEQFRIFGNYGRYFIPPALNLGFRGRDLFFQEAFTYPTGYTADTFPVDPVTGLPLVNLGPARTDLTDFGFSSACPVDISAAPGNPINGSNTCAIFGAGVQDPALAKLAPGTKATYEDEFILGGRYRQSNLLSFGVHGIYRKLGNVSEDTDFAPQLAAKFCGVPEDVYTDPAFDVSTSPDPTRCGFYRSNSAYYIWNPGSSEITLNDWVSAIDGQVVPVTLTGLQFPKMKRTYKALVFDFNRADDGRWLAGGSVTWSKLKGNTEGTVKSNAGNTAQFDAGSTTDMDYLGLADYSYGRLENDHRWAFKLFGAYHFTEMFTLGANIFVQSPSHGSCQAIHPTDAHAAAYGSNSFYCPTGAVDENGDYVENAPSPRGTGWKSNWLKQVDLSARVKIPYGDGDYRRVVLRADVFNVFNSKAVISRFSESESDNGTNPGTFQPEPTFLLPSAYQTPRIVRLGLDILFGGAPAAAAVVEAPPPPPPPPPPAPATQTCPDGSVILATDACPAPPPPPPPPAPEPERG